jgi:hypothetical protein
MSHKKQIEVVTDSVPLRDQELRELVRLAKIPEEQREYFSSVVIEAVEAAHEERDVKKLRLFRREQIVGLLEGLARDTTKVGRTLARMIGSETKISHRHIIAGSSLRAVLSERQSTIRTYISHLNALSEAAEAAVQNVPTHSGHPGGTVGYAAFDLFIYRLLSAAERSGGKWTIYKSANRWHGTLLRAITLVGPNLPNRFVPRAGLGSALDRLAKPFRARHPKNRP